MHVLVTGGAGFIGSNLVGRLLEDKRISIVSVLDNLATGLQQNINELSGNKKFRFVEGDIRDFETCLQACEGVDVFHTRQRWALFRDPSAIH